MRKVKLLLTFTLAIVSIFFLVGCNILDGLVKDNGGETPLSQILNRNTSSDDTVAVITNPEQGEQTVKLYFADKNGELLIEESRTIPKTLSLARETVNQWLLGPSGATDSYPVVNPQTTLKDIAIKNGIAIVDLSKEFLQPYSNVAAETALYGLVNTLTQFATVEIVTIRVEGQEIKTYRSLSTDNLRYRADIVGYSAGSSVDKTNKPIEAADESSVDNADSHNDSSTADSATASPSAINLFGS
ncbi:GerMN domain-containing protein [Dehalobacter sp. DCM]|uniref:GerMN domain-containing protein n=1 Tax=Dehalobacter sp. DCM TaxID=2907827 RepID=UPI0030820933|nr:GerMN domain-containing protein [Dehalobacter sp. DCM]